MPKFALLTVGNPKIAKGTKYGYLTAVLHLAPGSLSGFNVCPKATAGCLSACLNTAGRGGITLGKGRITLAELTAGTRSNAIQAARVRKTLYYFDDRAGFMLDLAKDICKLVKMAAEAGLQPAIRLNGTSDIPWERVPLTVNMTRHDNVMAMFPGVQFYDYTKRPNRSDLPSNYRLTFSLAEGNDNDAWAALHSGMNVAVVFRDVPVGRSKVLGGSLPVVDGDQHDLRFLDLPGSIVALKAKGNAKRDASGFVR